MESLRLGGDVQTEKKASSLGKQEELPWLSYTNQIEQTVVTIEESSKRKGKKHTRKFRNPTVH